MTFKELAEQYLKANPEGVWVHFNDYSEYPEHGIIVIQGKEKTASKK